MAEPRTLVDLNHPFLQLLREDLHARENIAEHAWVTVTDRGAGRPTHGSSRPCIIPAGTVESILAGGHVPSLREIGELARDCGHEPGDHDGRWNDYHQHGAAFVAAYGPRIPEEDPAHPKAAADTVAVADLPMSFPPLLRQIRESRWYYPYSPYNEQGRYVITAEEREALSTKKKPDAVRLSQVNMARLCRDRGVVYEHAETRENILQTSGDLAIVLNLLHCSIPEREALTSLHQPQPETRMMTEEEGQAFLRYRNKLRLEQKQLGVMAGYSTAGMIRLAELAQLYLSKFEEILGTLGFTSVGKFLEAEKALPEPPPLEKTPPPKVAAEHAAAFERYIRKRGMTPNTIASLAGYESGSPIRKIIAGEASASVFERVVSSLNFTSVEAFLAAEQLLPEPSESTPRPGREGHRRIR